MGSNIWQNSEPVFLFIIFFHTSHLTQILNNIDDIYLFKCGIEFISSLFCIKNKTQLIT